MLLEGIELGSGCQSLPLFTDRAHHKDHLNSKVRCSGALSGETPCHGAFVDSLDYTSIIIASLSSIIRGGHLRAQDLAIVSVAGLSV